MQNVQIYLKILNQNYNIFQIPCINFLLFSIFPSWNRIQEGKWMRIRIHSPGLGLPFCYLIKLYRYFPL